MEQRNDKLESCPALRLAHIAELLLERDTSLIKRPTRDKLKYKSAVETDVSAARLELCRERAGGGLLAVRIMDHPPSDSMYRSQQTCP